MVAGRGTAAAAMRNKVDRKLREGFPSGTRDSIHEAVREHVTAKVTEWLESHPTEQEGVINRNELNQLLSHVADREPSDSIIDLAMRRPEVILGRIPTSAAAEVCGRMCAYIQEHVIIDPIFAKFDRDGSGGLDRADLMPLLKLIAARSNYRDVSAEDVDYIVNLCDTDHSQSIEKDEVLVACATWKQLVLAKRLPSQNPKPASRACLIL
uniref:EF-hand domain-containing protein n=1 Tax=Haptolina brevifila TaxID=156173 RepID=A0A7S2JL67_9EUKA|mmetsp:Transcript_83787/g.167277  ORF Transcript_83787/g.167277 Transcript_83787/m.167277 type:complete len:210 (+) Transcript_83787:79-708(+)